MNLESAQQPLLYSTYTVSLAGTINTNLTERYYGQHNR